MCGLLFSNIPCKKEGFIKALSEMEYRGPDSTLNYAQYDEYKFGHNRLTILDKSNHGIQPFFSKDKRHLIIYNGEVYNYAELAKEYEIKLETHCDTELVLELYLKLGAKFLEKLNGMFALVIYDTVEKKLFIARDRLGIKPLYYYEKNGQFIFSSEVAPILRLTGDNKIDDFALRQYKKLRTFYNGRSIFSNIKMLEAGHYIDDGVKTKYWELPLHPKEKPSDEELKELLDSAIKYRMLSDVPLGSYLSGGLDSSIISKVIADNISEPFHTWTIGFKDNNEFKWGRIVADHIESEQHEILIDDTEFLLLLKEMIAIRKEPISVPNEVLIYKMTKEAKKCSTVLLSGEGADELFFGYDRIFSWANDNPWNIEEFTAKYAYGSEEDAEVVEDAISPFLSKFSNNIDVVAAFFQISHLHGLLRRLDSSSMLAKVEARVPFVDHRLIERMAGVPFNDRTDSNSPKKMLKRVYNSALPDEIINRPKVGFPVNLNAVLATEPGNNGYDKWLNLNMKILHDVI